MTWQTVKLGDVCELITDGTHNSPVYCEAGVPMLDSKHIKDGFYIDDSSPDKFISKETDQILSTRCKPAPNDILISSRGSIGKIAIVKEGQDFNIMGNMILLRLPKTISHKFLAYHLSNKVSHLVSIANGVAQKGLYLNQVRAINIPLPPLPEQKRIAAILDKADEIRRKRETAIAKLDQLAQSIFVEIFRDSIKSSVRIEMKDLIEEFRYGTSNKSGAFGYPALRIPNVAYGSLDLTELKTVEVSEEEFKRLKLLEGDLLFVRTNGNPEYVGRCVVFNPADVSDTRFNTSEYIYASYLIRARLKSFAVLPIVIQEFLSTAEGKQALRSRCKTSAGQFNINTESLGSLPIPKFPMPLQKSFIALKKSIEQQKIIHEKALTKQSQLFTTLQHQAFTGAL